MISNCPFCNKSLGGSPINKREVSLLRSTYKIYSSFIIPIPFVGSYIGGKISDWFSSPDEWYHRFICPDCRCSWIATENNPDIKTGGNQNLVTFYHRNTFVIGNVKEDLYMIQSVENGCTKNTVIYKDEIGIKTNTYINGMSNNSSTSFAKLRISNGYYIGEAISGRPNGWGVLFASDGHMWYGKWSLGQKQGIGFECDFDGTEYHAGYWSNNKFVI